MKRKLLLFGLPLLILISAYLYTLPLLRTGTGYSAKMMCSCLYVHNSNQNLETMRTERLNFSILGKVNVIHDDENKSVKANIFGLAAREARYIQGRGCVLINDSGKPLPPAINLPEPVLSQVAGDLPLRPDSITMLGVDQDKLNGAIDFGMQAVNGGGAHGIVILRNGKLLAEKYATGINADTRLLGWSMTKSITGALLGMRIAEGQIKLDETPVFREWIGSPDNADPRAEIPLLSLLRMNSGLKWEESYGSVTDATIMLHDQYDMAGYARKQAAASSPSVTWAYSSGTSNLLMDKIRRTFSSDEQLTEWIHNSLFNAIGANSFIIETDQSGLPVGSSYGWARARDWAKMGQLFLNKGRWQGKQIIPTEWVNIMLEPAAGSGNIYGGQLWLKGPDTPNLPDDGSAMRGFQDQRVFVLPSESLVIVRIGHNVDKTADFDGLIKQILAAIE